MHVKVVLHFGGEGRFVMFCYGDFGWLMGVPVCWYCLGLLQTLLYHYHLRSHSTWLSYYIQVLTYWQLAQSVVVYLPYQLVCVLLSTVKSAHRLRQYRFQVFSIYFHVTLCDLYNIVNKFSTNIHEHI